MFNISINEKQVYPTIILSNNENGFYAEVFCYGGFLNAYGFCTVNNTLNCVDGYSSTEEAIEERNTWFKSAFLSPFPCRMKNGKFEFDQSDFKIEKFYLGTHALHGCVYENIYAIKETIIDELFCSVAIHTTYEARDSGFPFPYSITHIYSLNSDNSITIKTEIVHHNDFAIPYAQGWHPYFSLGKTIDNCSLQFNSKERLECDETIIPTGNFIEDNRFLMPITLNELQLDSCFEILDKQSKCVLQSEEYKLTITALDGYPYLQIFTPDHRKSIAIENLSAAPDAFNNGLGLLLISPNKVYSFATNFCLQVLK